MRCASASTSLTASTTLPSSLSLSRLVRQEQALVDNHKRFIANERALCAEEQGLLKCVYLAARADARSRSRACSLVAHQTSVAKRVLTPPALASLSLFSFVR